MNRLKPYEFFLTLVLEKGTNSVFFCFFLSSQPSQFQRCNESEDTLKNLLFLGNSKDEGIHKYLLVIIKGKDICKFLLWSIKREGEFICSWLENFVKDLSIHKAEDNENFKALLLKFNWKTPRKMISSKFEFFTFLVSLFKKF